MSDSLPTGRYRHYKGKEYTVLGVARHSETQEEFVIYRPEYGERGLWVRPRAMFEETVEVAGTRVRRFEPLPAREEGRGNLFGDLPTTLPEEVFQTILTAPNVRIERIVSHGHASPEGFWYDQDQHEWVIVLQGAARLRFEDSIIEMGCGDFVNIPAHRRHRVESTTPDEPTIWLAVHYGG
jgi:cupin 2 domain-containing protein